MSEDDCVVCGMPEEMWAHQHSLKECPGCARPEEHHKFKPEHIRMKANVEFHAMCDSCHSIMFEHDLVTHLVIGKLYKTDEKGIYFGPDTFRGNVHLGCVEEYIDSKLWEQDTKGKKNGR